MDEALSLCGDYVLKTDQNLEAKERWNLYMIILRAEAGFKMLKGSLGLRPNFYQIETRVEGHIFISILAYHLLTRVPQKLAETGDTRDWKTACPTRRTEFKKVTPSTTLSCLLQAPPGSISPPAQQCETWVRGHAPPIYPGPCDQERGLCRETCAVRPVHSLGPP